MKLTDIYDTGRAFFDDKDYGRLLGYVETGFIAQNDRAVIDGFTLRQRCIDAEQASTECRVLEVSLAAPIIMSAMTAPIPAMHEGAMLKTARGLKAAGSLLWTGTPIPKDLKALVETGVPVAADVKPHANRDRMYAEIDALQAAGITWLGLEIDAGQGTKVGDREMGFECRPLQSAEIEAVKKRIEVPLICKGVLSGADAKKCVDAGADAIVVSSHGGHTLDCLPHPFQVMKEIFTAVEEGVAIIVDGGIRRGSDVFKALAFGANLVGIGRPVLYGLAADGETGVRDVVTEMTRELVRIMTMAGAARPDRVRRDMLIESPRLSATPL